MNETFTKSYTEMNEDELVTALNYLNDKKKHLMGDINKFLSTYNTVCALNLLIDEEIKESEKTLSTARTVVECYSHESSFIKYLLTNKFNYDNVDLDRLNGGQYYDKRKN